jgi:hypothetical protein
MKDYDTLMGEAYARGYYDGSIAQELGEPEEIPSPLSGEWAGESIPELFGLAIGEEYEETVVDDYEQQYSDGFLAGFAS